RGRHPQLLDLGAPVALVFGCMSEFEELGAALDVIEIGMSECDDVEVISRRLLQFVLQPRLEIDFRCLGVFSVGTMAEVEENTSPVRQHDLCRVSVANGIKDDSVCLGHFDSPRSALLNLLN